MKLVRESSSFFCFSSNTLLFYSIKIWPKNLTPRHTGCIAVTDLWPGLIFNSCAWQNYLSEKLSYGFKNSSIDRHLKRLFDVERIRSKRPRFWNLYKKYYFFLYSPSVFYSISHNVTLSFTSSSYPPLFVSRDILLFHLVLCPFFSWNYTEHF